MRFKSEKVLFHLKIYFKHGPGRVVPSTLSCEKLEYTYMAPLHGLYVLNKSSEGMKKNEFSYLKPGCEISNQFKWVFKT